MGQAMIQTDGGRNGKLWPGALRLIAVLALLTGSAAAQAPAETPKGGNVEQRLEHVEGQLKELGGGIGSRLGGHFGVVFPLGTWEQGKEPVSFGDNAVVGFPMGITIKKSDRLAFDLEFVPTIDDHTVNLTVHPGVLYGLGHDFTAGLRMAFDVDQGSWGFTPLINRKLFDVTESSHLFVELPLPIRIKDGSAAVTAALHVGLAF